MKNVKELLKDNEQIWFSIDDDENQKREFLRWAKQSGCTWREKEIDPEKDDCRIFMGIDKKLVLGYVGGHSWFQSTNSPKKINFKEFMEKNMEKIMSKKLCDFKGEEKYEENKDYERKKCEERGKNKIDEVSTILTSESVNIGHPDKTCDVIADAFLDEALSQDKNSQMAVECAIKNDKLFIYGEATTKAKIDYEKIAREILKDIGYKNEFTIVKELSQQSPDINQAVEKNELCANDQGIVFGYATNETKEYMPLTLVLAHKLMKIYEDFRQTRNDFFADAKSQVTVEYKNNKPIAIKKILISVSHAENLEQSEIQTLIKENVIDATIKEYQNLAKNTEYIINPSGKFTIWGSFGDSGCVGRKIVVDTYGGIGRVGGGCFSSKNATKVDRSGAYYARYVAKNIVFHGFCDVCEIQLSFGIGINRPLSININTFGTEKVNISKIYDYVENNFDFRLENIINELDLLRPIYKKTACYGHFGRDEFSWEKIKNQ